MIVAVQRVRGDRHPRSCLQGEAIATALLLQKSEVPWTQPKPNTPAQELLQWKAGDKFVAYELLCVDELLRVIKRRM